MTEDEARSWVANQPNVSRETMDSLSRLGTLIADENESQNLVAPSSLNLVWSRHIADSVQLLRLGAANGLWIDVGSGAGLPGMVIAILRTTPVLLVEPRRKRAEFLQEAVRVLQLPNVEVVQRDIRRVSARPRVISARAVASLDDLFSMTAHLLQKDTLYVLPKGRTALEELDHARRTWQGVFHVEQSVTDPDSKIVVASNVARAN